MVERNADADDPVNKNVNIELSNDLADPAHILDLIQTKFPDYNMQLANHAIRQQHLYQQFQLHDLLNLDPSVASLEQWVQMMIVLRGLCQHERLECEEGDLTALYSFLRECNDKLSRIQTDPVRLLRNQAKEIASLKASNESITTDNLSLRETVRSLKRKLQSLEGTDDENETL